MLFVSAGLWLEWLNDEQKLAVNLEEKEYLLHLYDRAIEDYPCMSLTEEDVPVSGVFCLRLLVTFSFSPFFYRLSGFMCFSLSSSHSLFLSLCLLFSLSLFLSFSSQASSAQCRFRI